MDIDHKSEETTYPDTQSTNREKPEEIQETDRERLVRIEKKLDIFMNSHLRLIQSVHTALEVMKHSRRKNDKSR